MLVEDQHTTRIILRFVKPEVLLDASSLSLLLCIHLDFLITGSFYTNKRGHEPDSACFFSKVQYESMQVMCI